MKIVDINGKKRDCENVTTDSGYPGFIKVNFKSDIRKGHKYSEWYPADKFIKLNPKLKDKVKTTKKPTKEDLGVVSSSGKQYLKDTTKNWKENIYSGYPLWISRGAGEGQQRTVLKNNKNTLYIDKGWKNRPNKTSQYVLSHNVQDNIEAYGNTLPDIVTRQVIGDLIKKAKKGTASKQ